MPVHKQGSGFQWAWIAGIVEGEGCLSISRGDCTLEVSMGDVDIIERLRTLSGVGRLYQYPHRGLKPRHKPMTRWTVRRKEDLLLVLGHIRPYLGERRGLKADQIVALLSQKRSRAPMISRSEYVYACA